MKSVFRQGERIFLREMSLRDLRDDEIRLRVEACGICGTDLHGGPETPHQFGHEIAGTVTSCGAAVKNCRPGDRVVLDSATPCGVCSNCKNGDQELCSDIRSIWHVPGFGLAEEMIAPAISAVPNPGLEPTLACLAEPLGVALDLHRLGDIRLGSQVVISGLGPIGLMALRLARLSGAERIYACGTSRSPARLAAARAWGADEVIEVDRVPLESYPFTRAPDRFLVTAPPSVLPGLFGVAAKGAIVAFIGIAHGEDPAITFDANAFHFRKLQLRASFASPALYTPRALTLLASGMVDGAMMVTHRFPLERTAEALECARRDPAAIKVVVNPC